jgi:formamidopyrimidine-DNA glycosylase
MAQLASSDGLTRGIMPELPEVETVVRGLRKDVVGRTFRAMPVITPGQIVTPSSDAFAARLTGQCVETLWRRGKYVIFDLSSDALLVHLKMTGRLYVSHKWQAEGADKYVRFVFELDNRHKLIFSDLRKLGRLHLVSRADDVVGALGPEPLSDDFTLDVFRSLMAQRRGTIKPLLLNQRFIAGIGNIYADEALWLAKVDPRRKSDSLKLDEVDRLYHAIREVLLEGIRHEGASIDWYRKPDGTTGEQQDHFSAYGREDEPCPRCEATISKIRLGQRGTHFCPACQS